MADTIHSGVDLIPTFIAFTAPGGPATAWRGACFVENEVVLTVVSRRTRSMSADSENQAAADLLAARSSVRTRRDASAWSSRRRKSSVDVSCVAAGGRLEISAGAVARRKSEARHHAVARPSRGIPP
ncbi:hypothetical protein ACQ4PT_009060 [Festuca glaucescens]